MEIPRNDTPTLAFLDQGGLPDAEGDREKIAICLDFLRVAKRALEFFYGRFEANGLTPGTYAVLMELLALEEGRGLSPSRIAARIGLSRSSLTILSDRLVDSGLIGRRSGVNDRRRLELFLTARGRKFLEDFLPGQFADTARVMRDIDDEARDGFRKSLRQLETNIEALRFLTSEEAENVRAAGT